MYVAVLSLSSDCPYVLHIQDNYSTLLDQLKTNLRIEDLDDYYEGEGRYVFPAHIYPLPRKNDIRTCSMYILPLAGVPELLKKIRSK